MSVPERRSYCPKTEVSVPERGSYCPKTEVSVLERNGITQDRGISSRKENASQLDQDAVPANKRSQKLPSIGETQKLRIVLSPQQEKLYK